MVSVTSHYNQYKNIMNNISLYWEKRGSVQESLVFLGAEDASAE